METAPAVELLLEPAPPVEVLATFRTTAGFAAGLEAILMAPRTSPANVEEDGTPVPAQTAEATVQLPNPVGIVVAVAGLRISLERGKRKNPCLSLHFLN